LSELPLDEIAGHLHAGQRYDAARVVLRWAGNLRDPKNDDEVLEPLRALVYGLLSQNKKSDAAKLLWTPNKFTYEPRCVKLVWSSIDAHACVLLQGASSMSKTFSAGASFYLDWVYDPQYTTVRVIGPTEEHLAANLFSHLIDLHTSASIPIPGIVGDLYIGLDRRNQRGSIKGLAVPKGSKGAGRLQGVKRFNRPQPHPVFGPQSRLRVLLDEFEQIPESIFSDINNIFSNAEGKDGFKLVGAYNPIQVGSYVYVMAEPVDGWGTFDIEKDEQWTSRRGWHVVRLDGEKHENVVLGENKYPGFPTREKLEILARNNGGYDSAGYSTMARGAYPRQGTSLSIIPQSFITDFKVRFIWLETPKRVAAVDSALEGADPAVMAIGSFGLATGVEFPPSLKYPNGRLDMFKDANGRSQTRYAVCVDQLLTLASGDTVKVSTEIKDVCKTLGLDPGWLMVDRTGNGAGVHDLLKEFWAPEVRGLNYSESATHMKILEEDSQFADEIYNRVDVELWYALRRWLEVGAIKGAYTLETEKLFEQLTSRQRKTEAGSPKIKIEPKRDYKHRMGGKSPNDADSVCLLLHCVRLNSGAKPGITVTNNTADQNWDSPVSIVGITDRFEDLSTPEQYDWMPGRDLESMD